MTARALPLHQRIRLDIEAQILSGALAPGERIPFEHELMVAYACSRMTVSKAISALADAGLVQRRRRAGSFVARPRVQSAVLDIPDIQADVAARGGEYGYRLLSRRIRPASADRGPGLAGDLLELACLHFADGRPFAFEERLISLAAVPEARDADFAAEAPGAWLLGHAPWTEAEHRITAVGAGDEVARALGVTPGAACLSLQRRTWRGDDHITYVRQTFPGDAYDLVASFGPAR